MILLSVKISGLNPFPIHPPDCQLEHYEEDNGLSRNTLWITLPYQILREPFQIILLCNWLMYSQFKVLIL